MLKNHQYIRQVKKKGLTLIEVCVTIAIFVAVVLYMLGIFQQGFRYIGTSRERSVAINMARAIIEENSYWNTLKKFDLTPGVLPDSGPLNNTYALPSVTLNYVTYACSLTIADGPIYGSELKKITATVSWSRGDRNFNVSFSTLKNNLNY